MKCLECEADALRAIVQLTYDAPMAQRLGTIKLAGLKVTQLDVKEAWDKQESVRGPIRCFECGADHIYVMGSKEPLRLGTVADYRVQNAAE